MPHIRAFISDDLRCPACATGAICLIEGPPPGPDGVRGRTFLPGGAAAWPRRIRLGLR